MELNNPHSEIENNPEEQPLSETSKQIILNQIIDKITGLETNPQAENDIIIQSDLDDEEYERMTIVWGVPTSTPTRFRQAEELGAINLWLKDEIGGVISYIFLETSSGIQVEKISEISFFDNIKKYRKQGKSFEEAIKQDLQDLSEAHRQEKAYGLTLVNETDGTKLQQLLNLANNFQEYKIK